MRTVTALLTAASGLRSSWASIARNSSLRRSFSRRASACRSRSAKSARLAYWRRRSRRAARTVLTSDRISTGRRISVMCPTDSSSRAAAVVWCGRRQDDEREVGPGGLLAAGAGRGIPPCRRGWPRRGRWRRPPPLSISGRPRRCPCRGCRAIPAAAKTWPAAAASRLVGASRRTRSSSSAGRLVSHRPGLVERPARPAVGRRPGEHAVEIAERLPDA